MNDALLSSPLEDKKAPDLEHSLGMLDQRSSFQCAGTNERFISYTSNLRIVKIGPLEA